MSLALGSLSGQSQNDAHSLTVEVVGGWGGVYVQSCTINGTPLPAAIVPHDVLQVRVSCVIEFVSVSHYIDILQPPAVGPISNASAVYLGVDALEFADGWLKNYFLFCSLKLFAV